MNKYLVLLMISVITMITLFSVDMSSQTNHTIFSKSICSSMGIKYDCDSKYGKWWRDIYPKWEINTKKFIYGSRSKCLVSFGEWIGPIVLFKPTHFERITVYEPDPMAYLDLTNNVLLNQPNSIEVYNRAVCLDSGFITMTGSGQSGSSIYSIPYNNGSTPWRSLCKPLAELLKENENCIFKIDVEGYEEVLIDVLLKRPPLSLSLSEHWGYYQQPNVFKDKLNKMRDNYLFSVDTGSEVYMSNEYDQHVMNLNDQ